MLEQSGDHFFSEKEFIGRMSRLQQLMQGENIDVFVVNWRPDLYYCSGTAQDAQCIIFSDDHPELLVRRDFRIAKENTWIDSVHQISGFRDVAKRLKTRLNGKKSQKIALTLDALPTVHYLRLKQLLPLIEFVDGSSLIRQVRSVKSLAEIEMMEQAAEIAKIGHEEVAEQLQPGMREAEISALASKAMLEAGHQGYVFFRVWNNELLPQGHCISGENGTVPSYVASPNGGMGISALLPQGSSNRKIKKNEPILVDLVGCYHGYCADETRTYWIGSLPDSAREQLDHCLELEELTTKLIKSGEKPQNVYQQVLNHHVVHFGEKNELLLMARREGVGFLGHGVGLEIDEWPILTEKFSLPFEAGNTIAIEPKVRIVDVGLVGIEDTYALSSDGLKRITTSPLHTE